MKYPRLFGRLFNSPLLLLPDKALVLEQVFRSMALPQAASFRDEPLRPAAWGDDDSPTVRASHDTPRKPYGMVGNGVALIPVMGTLVQRGSWMDAASGLTSYDRIASLTDAAMRDPDVRAVLLDIDSPGGEVNGLFTLTDRLRRMAKHKPIWGFANEQAYSAAYAVGTAVDKLYLPKTGGVGSVGVIALHVDQSKRDAAQGYSFTPIFAGDRKADGSSHAPLSDRARAGLQAEIDRLYGMFVDHVALGRSLDRDAVIATQAGLLNADAAVEGRFADGIASLDEVVEMLSDSAKPKTLVNLKGNTRVTTQADDAKVHTAAEMEQARATATAQARESERKRIAAILDLPAAQGCEGLARKIAMTTDMDAATAAMLLEAAPKGTPAAAAAPATPPATHANPFAAQMAAMGNPVVGLGNPAGSADADPNDPAKIAASILSAGK